MNQFKALLVLEEPEFKQQVVQRNLEDLPEGEVLIKVEYSSLNYKDALSATGNRGVTRNYPHTPGIDAAGVVKTSSHSDFKAGDTVIVTGYDLGMNTSGGFSEYIRVPASWVIKCPEGLSTKESMVLGTAGLTAALCIDKLLQAGLTPEQGKVLVTGATGGVGSIAVRLLAQQGYSVTAVTGKPEQAELLKAMGAKEIIAREAVLEGKTKVLLKPEWAAVVDTVGGDLLFNALKAVKYGGSVACCGLTAGTDFHATVFPFILRGVNLLGVDSVELPLATKQAMWQKLSREWKLPNLEQYATEIPLEALPEVITQMLSGLHVGRTIVAP